MRLIDNTVALRIIYLLVQPIESTDAYKLGLINSSGETLRKAKTTQEKNSTSMLHRLCWRIKKVFSLVPGGKTKLGSLAAAYLLVRESLDKSMTEEQATELFFESIERSPYDLGANDLMVAEIAYTIADQVGNSGAFSINEDGEVPGNTTASLGSTIDLPMMKPLRRSKPVL